MHLCMDLGLQIMHPDLGQPSQASDCGKNVKVSIYIVPSTEEATYLQVVYYGQGDQADQFASAPATH
jgi:hypothetical protein